jgi:hypothetical protein
MPTRSIGRHINTIIRRQAPSLDPQWFNPVAAVFKSLAELLEIFLSVKYGAPGVDGLIFR